MQKAEKAGNAMVLELIAANEEARGDRLDWEKKCVRWRIQKRQREPNKIAS